MTPIEFISSYGGSSLLTLLLTRVYDFFKGRREAKEAKGTTMDARVEMLWKRVDALQGAYDKLLNEHLELQLRHSQLEADCKARDARQTARIEELERAARKHSNGA